MPAFRGVVAMRYNIYVLTAAQFAADLYAHLLAGKSLGQAATAARRSLAADPVRQIGATPVELQDWVVPVVYESAPLVLLRPPDRAAPVVRLDASGGMEAAAGVPRSPDAGFFGRDETLLALDRAFDDRPLRRPPARVRWSGQILHGGGVRTLVFRDRSARLPGAS